MTRAALALGLALVAPGCGKHDPPRPTSATPPAVTSSLPVEAAAPVELLWSVPSIVAVSSRVDNPRDLPDFIVDRKPETAWNGRTGELAGGYVAFRVPKDARVAWVELVVGYDRKTETEDLFTANVRIKKVRVWRDRRELAVVALDPDKREAQRIPIDQGGGDFKLEIVEVALGTKKAWRELVVSELAVWGTPGAKRHARRVPPPVRVGGLDPSMPETERPVRAASLDAACKAYESDSKVAFAALLATGATALGDGPVVGEFTCTPGASLDAGKALALDAYALEVTRANPLYYNMRFDGATLGLKTSTGAFATSVRLRGHETALYWTSDWSTLAVTTATTAAGRDAIVAQVVERRVTDSDGAGTPEELHDETVTHHGTICELDARGAVTCVTTSTDLLAKLHDAVKPSPLRKTSTGELVIDVADARPAR